jgi:hypothetical protein
MVLTSASFLRMYGGLMFASAGSHCSGVDLTVPLITLITLLSCVSILLTCVLLNQTRDPYSAVL